MDKHHVHIYTSRDIDGTIMKMPCGSSLSQNSIATPSLIVSTINGKYNNALSLEQQTCSYKDNGIHLATNTMASNYAEQAIRPFTIWRKNFVLIETTNGASASAIIYSLVETSKANYLNVYQYFELLLTKIPKHMDDTYLKFINELLTWIPPVLETCPSRFNKS